MTLPLTDDQNCIWTSLFQGHISHLLLLACMATAAAATVLGVNSLIRQTSVFYYTEIISTCDVNPEDTDWKTERCREYLNMMMVRTEHTTPSLSGAGALEGRNEKAQ